MKNQAMNIKTLLLFDSVSEVPEGEPPGEFMVMRYGASRYTKGNEEAEIEFSLADAEYAVEEFNKRGKDIVVDYEHQTLSGAEAPAAGWIKALTAAADGLKAVVEWTPRAASMMRGREYRYFSPVINQTRRHKVLHSVALTNHPALHGIPALVADDMQGEAGSVGAVDIEDTDNKQTTGARMKRLREICSKLGTTLPDDTPEDQALGALEAGIDGLLDKLKSIEAVKAGMVSMTDYDSLKAQVSAMAGENKKIQARRAVDEGIKARKVTPSMEPWALLQAEKDLQAFNDTLKILPESVPAVPGAVPAAVSEPAGDMVALTDLRQKIASKFGSSVEDLYGKSKSKGV
jgi:phage I-like protein